MESTPVWISTSEGWPLYNMCLDVKHGHVHESAKLVMWVLFRSMTETNFQ